MTESLFTIPVMLLDGMMTKEVLVASITIFGGGIMTLLGTIVKVILDNRIANNDFKQKSLDKFDEIASKIDDIDERTVRIERTALENRDGIKKSQRKDLFGALQRAIYRGYTTIQERTELRSLYDSYVGLGGNGPIKDLFNEYLELPIKEEN
ncbi:hypothetical protein NHG29_01535 [Aerococcaceae bacterium NML160702]|nr:hypothetical protein [Aerococcaceae bacterium NML190073]MCW6681548.1 hypothetical protein [Aerococcaceae bacterium NML160702]